MLGATLTLLIYAALAVTPLVALRRADAQYRWLALAACVLTLAVSLPHFASTPDGVLQDSLEYVGGWQDRLWGGPRTEWPAFFSLFANVHGAGWGAYPVALGRYLTGTWLAERVIGLGWHLVLVVTLVTAPFTAGLSVMISIAIVSATRFGLWTQRHHQGSDLLVQQVLLLVALWRAERSRWWAAAAGLLTGLAMYNYIPAMARLAYPAVVLRRGSYSRLVLIYVIAAVVALPALCAPWPEDVPSLAILSRSSDQGMPLTPQELWLRASLLLRAFYDSSASTTASWCWSFVGAQRLPLIAGACIVLGAVVALRSFDGRTWVILALGGLVPNLLSDARGAASHREIMALVPLAVLAAYSVRVVPSAWRTYAVIALVMWITVAGYYEWMDPSFWANWSGGVYHGFTDATMVRR